MLRMGFTGVVEEKEFDISATGYQQIHERNLSVFGEGPGFVC